MNQVSLVGRITKDLELKYTQSQQAVCNFSIAINRKDRVDYPDITVWGKQAENLNAYCGKGSLVGIEGRIQTSTYEKDGKTIYKTEVYADRVEFLSRKEKEPEFDY